MASVLKRITPNGVAYQVRVRIRGNPTQTKTFDKLSDARFWGQQTESEIKNGLYFKKRPATKHTFGEMIDRYIAIVLPRKATNPKYYVNQLHQLEWWKAQLGAFLLSNVTPANIAELRDKLTIPKDGVKLATGNRYLAALSHVYSIAHREWGWVEDNPVRKVDRLKEPRGRTRYLDLDEQRKLLEVCSASRNPHLLLVALIALSTGARQMEIMGLQWKHVDLERAQITLVYTKNGEQRSLPLIPSVLLLMKERHAGFSHISTYVFPNGLNTRPAHIHSAFQKAVKQANIDDFRFHDLRHTAASYLAMSGATLAEIAEVMGHKTLNMVKRYSHISIPHTRKVIERMNQQFLDGAK